MPTLRSSRAVALAVVVLAACGERAPSAPAAPSSPAAAPAPTPSAAAPSMVPAGDAAAPQLAPQLVPGPGAAPAAPAAPAGPGGSVAAAGAAPAGAPPAGPASVSTVLREAVALEPGGALLALAAEAETVIDPGARFRVVLAVASEDARLLLLDRNDAVVAGEGAHELGQSTKLTLAPSAPLVAGRRYTLRIDGASTRELHGPAGTAFTPVSFKVLVAGTPPPPEPERKPATRRKRRDR